MAQVTNIEVRFLRRMQIQEYSPAEAEISYSIQLDEGDDAQQVGLKSILECKSTVLHVLTGKDTGKTGEPKKASVKKRETAKSQVSSDIPDETPSSDNQNPDAPEAPPTIPTTQRDIQQLITQLRKDRKVSVEDVKNLLEEFGVKRTSELPESEYANFTNRLLNI